MGLLDLFSKKSGVEKHAARVANKRAQAQDRWESIRALGAMKTPEAVDALLVRLTFTVDPSITDQEEKEAVQEAIVEAGEAAVEPLRRFLRSTDSIARPLRCLDKLLDEGEVVAELLSLLEGMDTEYERDPQKKTELLAALEDRRDERIVDAVRRFLDDINEPVRFCAVGALVAQGETREEDVRTILIEALLGEESTRVRAHILDGFIERGWSLGSRAADAKDKLPAGYSLGSKGAIKRRAQ
ncbi:MAG: HEAT repeat domain-containing protein [Myxococcota bacterium]